MDIGDYTATVCVARDTQRSLIGVFNKQQVRLGDLISYQVTPESPGDSIPPLAHSVRHTTELPEFLVGTQWSFNFSWFQEIEGGSRETGRLQGAPGENLRFFCKVLEKFFFQDCFRAFIELLELAKRLLKWPLTRLKPCLANRVLKWSRLEITKI